MVTPVYGIFEGGGAKGIGHLAGLKAAERSGLVFIGVAGASAGALIAALVAVGYSADELFDPNTPTTNLLSRHGINPLSLLGEREWPRFETAQRKAACTAKWTVFGGALAAFLASPSAFRVAKEIRSSGGYFTTEHVRETLNNFLHTKVRMHHANAGRTTKVPERIRFQDIDPALVPECCSLKVIVTDVTNQRMVVFGGGSEFAEVEVAEAVAASIAIPLVFKPASIRSYRKGGDALYADGGLVSNFPVWVFAEEKLNYERAFLPLGKVPVLAFSLRDDMQAPPLQPAPGSMEQWVAMGRTAIFGGQTVAQRFAPDLRPVEMPIRLGVTEFNFTVRRALEGYNDAYAVARRTLVRDLQLLPARRTELLKEFHDKATTLMRTHPAGSEVRDVRVSLIQPLGTASFRVTNSYNMDHDADDRLVLSRLAQGAPVAFDGRAPAHIDYAAMWAAGGAQNMTKYEFALLRRSLSSAICLPIFTDATAWQEPRPHCRPQPLGIVSIDSDQGLAKLFSDRAVLQALATYSLALASALEPIEVEV